MIFPQPFSQGDCTRSATKYILRYLTNTALQLPSLSHFKNKVMAVSCSQLTHMGVTSNEHFIAEDK